MKSRLLILVIALLSITIAGQAFAASTLIPYPVKVPKGAFVNGGGVNANDNFFWQMLTLTTADSMHIAGNTITINLPSGMTVADVNSDGTFTDEISTVFNDIDNGAEFTGLSLTSINGTHNNIILTIGGQRVANGTFTGNADGWTIAGAGAAYNANAVDMTAGSTLVQDLQEVAGEVFYVTFQITAVAGGTVTPTIGSTAGVGKTTVGTHTQTITGADTGNFTLACAGGTATVDNVVVTKTLLKNGDFAAAVGWDAGTGWTIGANASHVAGAANTAPLTQGFGVFATKKYTVQFDVGAGAGTVTPFVGTTAGTAVAAGAGTVYQQITAAAGGLFGFTPSFDFTGTIDNVSVTEESVTNGTFDTNAAGWVLVGSAWNALGTLRFTAGVATATQNIAASAGQVYRIKYTVSNRTAGTVTASIGGVSGAATAANGTVTEAITAGAGVNLVFTSDGVLFDGDLDNIQVELLSTTAGGMEVGDKIYVMVPVETSAAPSVSSDDWYVDFSNTTMDDIANGSGTAITYVDPGPNALALVTFADNLSADNDTTSAKGDVYPTAAAATFGSLPDMAVDSGEGVQVNSHIGLTLNAAEGSNETLYSVWVSTDPNLAHIDSTASGVFHALKSTDLSNYLVNETNTGGVQYALSGYPEGVYYFYITSYLTGNFPIARSGKLVIRHWPVINLVGFDRDHDTSYVTGAGNDDQNVTLDSGTYYNYAGTKAAPGTQYTYLDLFTSVDDLDDNATVYLYYSTNASIDTTAVLRSGSPVDGTLAITGLTGATAIASGLLENSEDELGYIKSRWQVHPDSIGVVLPAGGYSIYAVTCDGKHFEMSTLKGAGAVALTTNIKHSPNLTIDALSEYDTNGAAGIQIDVKSLDTVMLSWGKTGVNGALDYDDSDVISFYIHKDTDATSDYSHDGQNAGLTSTIWNDAATDPSNTHRIVTGLQEDLHSKGNMVYAWNLKEDFKATGWYPTDGANYFIYATIDENKTGGTVRCIATGTSGSFFTAGVTNLAGEQLIFTNSPMSQLSDPPVSGVTINAEESYRLRLNAFDWDTDADIGVFAVRHDQTGYESGPMSTTTAAIDTLGTIAYMLNDDNGDYHSGNVTVSENSSAYYDAQIRTPGSLTAKYTNKMNGVAATLGDDTYWIYVGSTKETSFADRTTNGTFTGSAAGWTLGGSAAYAANAVNLVVGAAAGTATQNVNVVVGHTYLLQYEITAYAAACAITPTLGGVAGVARTATGVYNEIITATTTGNLIISGSAAGSCTIDNVKVTPYATLYRAPGPLTVLNSGLVAVQRNLTVSPAEATVAQGDTISFIVRASDNGGTVDRIDTFIAVEKTYLSLVNPTAPYTASLAYTGKIIANQVIDDAANNRWILQAITFNAGTAFDLSDSGAGDAIATIQLVSKGTASALQEQTSIYYVNEPVHGWVTKFSNDGSDISVNTLASTVKVVPRPIVEGIVQLQGRNNNDVPVTFQLRKRGSYSMVSDSLFTAINDADSATAGVQFTPDADGKFTFTKCPIGEYDLIASYSRYLTKKVQVNLYAGLDTLFVNFGVLKGGDCIGYTDSLNAVYPDNQIDSEDINRISTAFNATSANAKWSNGADNWMWADVNEDNIVDMIDLSMATANVGSNGDQPRYKAAGQPIATNMQSLVEFANVPSMLKAGESYTIQVIARNTAEVRAYFVNMKYNAGALSLNGIWKGDFISSDSHSFPVVGEGTVGLANSVYGDAIASGNGILAEVSFTALHDGAFSSDMLAFDKVEFVNATFRQEELIDNATSARGTTPEIFALGQNFPNPFNPSTTIGFTLPEASRVSIDIYDILGRHVRTLTEGSFAAGKYSAVWDARDANGLQVSTGIYIYKIKAGNFTSVKRMAFMK